MVPSPRHAWTIGRILAGKPVNGEVDELLPPFQAIGRRMLELPIESRSLAWECFLDGHTDRVDINAAVAAIVIEGPQPDSTEPDERLGDEWGPIRLGTLPPVEPFPLELLPEPARDLAKAASRSISCPIDFPAVATLAAASGVIGRSVSILIKDGYFQSASLYLALVGDSSDGKSPSLDAAMIPIRTISTTLNDEHLAALAEWQKVPEKERRAQPRSRRIDTSNPTVESLAPILATNPRGMILLPDEFTGWLLSIGQYKSGKGGDRQFYLSAWNSATQMIDRVKDGGTPTVVPYPYLTIVGGLTPGRLGLLANDGGDEDGFMSRILFTYPDAVKGRRYSEEGIPQDIADNWRALIEALWSRKMNVHEGKSTPHVLSMTHEARSEWRDRCQAHMDEQECDGFSRSLRGPWGKLQAYAARLALVLACMRYATDPLLDPQAVPKVDGRLIRDAWRLVDYFKSQARRVYAGIQGRKDEGNEDVRALLGWIMRNEKTRFSIRDLDRNFDRFKDDAAAQVDALDWMTDRNLIRPEPELKDAKRKPGRKRSPSYEVNPGFWESPRFRQFRQNGLSDKAIVGNVGNAVPSEDME